jgi:multicomponent Na+:H+ antiporter subunit F
VISAILWILLFLAALGFWRVIAGPTVPDRIVAADAISVILTTMLALMGLVFDSPVFLDIAIAFAVLAFADVLIMAKFFEHGALHL